MNQFLFVAVKFRNDLWREVELKLPPPLKSVTALTSQNVWSATQLYISENNMIHVKQHLFHEFVFVYLFFFLILSSL